MEGLIHGGAYFRNSTVSYCNDEITLVTRRIDPDSKTIVISDDFVREKNQNKLALLIISFKGEIRIVRVFFYLSQSHYSTP